MVIPADAGNSPVPGHMCNTYPVYPRSRGELLLYRDYRRGIVGLSPLARGTRLRLANILMRIRFIPARAGNSQPDTNNAALRAVYPRSRGELSKHNLLLINDFLSQSQSTNFTVSHKQHIHYVKEHLTN